MTENHKDLNLKRRSSIFQEKLDFIKEFVAENTSIRDYSNIKSISYNIFRKWAQEGTEIALNT